MPDPKPKSSASDKSPEPLPGDTAGRAPSVFDDLIGDRSQQRAVTVTDLAGVVIGFSVAAAICRGTILAHYEACAAGLTTVAAILMIWLGGVISGPFVLVLRRMQHGRRSKFSSGELAWCLVGLLWLAVGISRGLRTLDPATMSSAAQSAAAAAGALAPLALLFAWRLERARARPSGPYSWCHHAGILCAAAWPAGWTLAAFLLGV